MAKQSGLGVTTLSVGDASNSAQAIVNDFTEFTLSTPRAVQDVTGLDKSAHERLLLLADCSFGLKGVFDGAANRAHAVFSTVPSTSVARTVTLVINAKTLASNLLFTDYTLARAAGGELTFDAPGVLADGTVPTWS